ncbi:MAG: glucose-6-phosphate dehydrogenase [Verrucomicrobia bacterium]|nr:glucose-6-phosphate dehydrogenase [Verrucomicrobiota bacterium]
MESSTPTNDSHAPLSIAVIGASGHLARTKVIPSLFALYCQGQLPDDVQIIGYARSVMTDEAFRKSIEEHLTCRYMPEEKKCADYMQAFLSCCRYIAGQYESCDSYKTLKQVIDESGQQPRNILVYLAIPPNLFVKVSDAIGRVGMARRGATQPWTRVVIEKPFGRDRASSDELLAEMAAVLDEGQIYRIDHYLGKEVIQNLMVLRFANLVFEPIWNHRYIKNVQITWKENISIQGRGGYFDGSGIIRDVMQNHLLQMLALIAMEPPARLDAQHIRNAKVNALINVPPATLADIVIGQYTGVKRGSITIPGYTEDESVPSDSKTPTFAAVVLKVQNPRWDGVPFVMCAGKGLDGRMTEIRIQFKDVPGSLFRIDDSKPPPNELVIRVQPDESIYFTIVSKVPGIDMKLEPRRLDLEYDLAFKEAIHDAYEDLIVDVLNGEKSLFIRGDELSASWDIFTPVLHAIEDAGLMPERYDFGSTGPAAALDLAAGYGVSWT